MNPDQIKELFSYQIWANQKLLHFSKDISFENLTHNFSSSFSSIRDTLAHILGAEELWLSRWMGVAGHGLLSPLDFTTHEVLCKRWVKHDDCLSGFIDTLTNEDLTRLLSYTNLQGTPYTLELWKQMLHVSNHSSYHRGQVVTMIRQLNMQPPSLDLIYYYLGMR